MFGAKSEEFFPEMLDQRYAFHLSPLIVPVLLRQVDWGEQMATISDFGINIIHENSSEKYI